MGDPIVIGSYLGEMTDEYPDAEILEFVGGSFYYKENCNFSF